MSAAEAALGHRLVFESFGTTAEVVSDDRWCFAGVPDVLPPGWRAAEGETMARFGLLGAGAITLDGVVVAHAPDRDAALLRLGSVVRHHLALHAPGHVFVHAGVVEVAGVGIVIPGSSFSGKTTLVAELVEVGAAYGSDEYAVVGPDGLIQPYAKPLSVRRAGRSGLGEPVHVPGERVVRGPVRAGLVVVTSYERDAEWRPTVRTRAEGAAALLGHTVVAQTDPARALAAVGRVSRGAHVVSSARGDARETAAQIMKLVDRLDPVGADQ